MKTHIAHVLYEAKAELAEGALWDHRTNKLLWVDIRAGKLNGFDPKTGKNDVFEIGSEVGAVVLEEGKSVMLAIRNGFARYDMEERKLEMVAEIAHETTDMRFNDGKCDPQGRFWAGSMVEGGRRIDGKLYRLERNGVATMMRENIGISNGLAWSPDGRKMYHVDSKTCSITAFDLNDAGEMVSPRVVLSFSESEETPDGMTRDEEGMLWVALWNGGRVVRVDPEKGSVTAEVLVPHVRKITSCAFGGEDFRTLFITTAREVSASKDASDEPLAGSIFMASVEAKGEEAYQYKSEQT